MFTRYRQVIRTAEDARAAYSQLYGAFHLWVPSRHSLCRWLLRLMHVQPGKTLLDVACGGGELLLAAQSAGLRSFGVDISDRAVLLANEAIGQIRAVVSDGAALPFPDASFDYVTNVGSLEHYGDMESGVREMARVLKPEGTACVLLPNAFGLTWNVLHVWRTGDIADDGYQPIQRFATRRAWQSLLESNGLAVQRVVRYERVWPKAIREKLAYITQPKELLLFLAAPLIPLNLARCFVFLCNRSEA
jgi:SAM-dependent methyltransferase